MRWTQVGAALLGLGVVGTVAWFVRSGSTSPQAVRPDVLLVTLDTTRADHLGAYGYFRDTSPNLDALAASGLLFEHHVVPQATTLPSHLSLFTGVYPDEHGVVSNSNEGDRWLVPDALSTLAGHLAARGYQTAAFVSATPLKRSSGIDRGFDRFDQPEGRDRVGEETTDAALAWLEDEPTEPWLLWVHLFDPHTPYRSHDDGFAEGDDAARDAWLEARGIPVRRRTRVRVDEYDAEIRYADAQLGRLLERLRADPDRPRVVVVAGDHGEGMGEHGHYQHGRVWRGELEAPLVVRAPGLQPGRVSVPISTVDVLPTVLGLAEFPEEGALLEQVTGRDVLRGGSVPVLSRSSLRQSRLSNHPQDAIPPRWAITTEGWTYVLDSFGRQYLFDREADPYEEHNLAFDQPERSADLRARLDESLAAHRERADRLGAGGTVEGDAIEREELEALGYTE